MGTAAQGLTAYKRERIFTWSFPNAKGFKIKNQITENKHGKPQIKVTHQKMNGVEPAGPELDMTAKTVVPGTMGQYRDNKGRELVFKYTQHLNDGSGKSKKTWVYLRYEKYESYVKEVKCETRVHGVLVQGSEEHITRDETFDAQIFWHNKPNLVPFTWSQRLEPKSRMNVEGKSKISITCTPSLEQNGEARRMYHMYHSLNGDVSHKFLQAKRRRHELPNGDTMITMPQPAEMLPTGEKYSIFKMTYEIYITNNQVREVKVKTHYRWQPHGMTFHSDEREHYVPADQTMDGIHTTRTIKNMAHPSNRV